MSKMKNHEKHKAIAIPVSFSEDNTCKFLTVRDRRFREWTFVTGGCRKTEISNPLRCALRELEEETRGTINIKKGQYSYFNFKYSPPYSESNKTLEDITYHVYILEVNIPKNEQFKLISRFNLAKSKLEKLKQLHLPIKLVYDENDIMNFETLSEFKSKGSSIWELIRNNILDNQDFYKALSSERQFFNINNNYYNDSNKSLQFKNIL
jgi:8-oxo-dGTP pyrophosphatase MutT (NUDIX family)